MNKVIFGLTIVIALLSLAAGTAKVLQAPQEVEFLSAQGLNISMIIAFGLIQIVGGILLILPKFKLIGSIVCLIAFAISTILILMSGNITFAVISVLPILVLAFIIYRLLNVTRDTK